MESSSPMFERDHDRLAPGSHGGVPLPPPRSRDRDGLSALERKALYRVHTELPAMPASLVVQILLWPEKITDWARGENVTPALVYNMLGGFKPYHGLRERLAERLGVTKGAVDHLIDARRQQPSTRRIPEPPDDFAPDDVQLASRPTEPGTPSASPDAASTASTSEPRSDAQRPDDDAPPPPQEPEEPPTDNRQTSLDL